MRYAASQETASCAGIGFARSSTLIGTALGPPGHRPSGQRSLLQRSAAERLVMMIEVPAVLCSAAVTVSGTLL
ncbi:hypothetical protein [Streptomyces sp. NPDC056361]|uniref:hypothetical protein n=1 Tax=Streptomyces sp. NPDC056361 TaxID=3345795 RepID=UPI0035D6FEB2